ncbi:MAG: hypothetical protein RL219_2375 [Actinomycetota bacterium]|jgi:predicted GNAT superfamily acetyltransferase
MTKSSELRIDDLVAADLPEALVLNNAAVPALSELDTQGLADLVAQRQHALAVRNGARLVGFCLTFGAGVNYASPNYRWFSDRFHSFSYLDRIVIEPSLRSRGAGTALYAELERRIGGDLRWLLCEVNVRPLNAGSLRFHQRIGFVEVGQQNTGAGAKRVSLLAKPLVRR